MHTVASATDFSTVVNYGRRMFTVVSEIFQIDNDDG
jgi:hypothetical protein